MAKHKKTNTPVCPHCYHAMKPDEMINSDVAIFDIAPREESLNDPIVCPACGEEFWVAGGYEPHYTTGLTENEVLEE